MTSTTPILFLEDTVCLSGSPEKIGVISRTWHDLDEAPADDAELDEVHFDSAIPEHVITEFFNTGQPPRDYVVVSYSSPNDGLALLHQSSLVLLDRLLHFGDLVKTTQASSTSGTVTDVSTSLVLKHSFLPSQTSPLVMNVSNADVRLSQDWVEGELIIWKSWLGVIEEVVDEVSLRLQDGSVVIPERPEELNIPVWYMRYPNSGSDAAAEPEPSEALSLPGTLRRRATSDPARRANGSLTASTTLNGITNDQRGPARRDKTVPPPEHLAPGQYVRTTKGNLRRGIWKFGSYNPDTPPEGYILGVENVKLGVSWLCQNTFMTGTGFVPTPRPDEWVDLVDFDNGEAPPLIKFHRQGGSTWPTQVGDRVRFRDINDIIASQKYPGVSKVSREHSLGYDVNTFVVVGTQSTVSILWQDGTRESRLAVDCTHYLNIDDHDTWPGEIVISREEVEKEKHALEEDVPEDVSNPQSWVPRFITDSLSALARGVDPIRSGAPRQSPGSWFPKRVGVVQSIHAADRLAKVRWFKDPQLEVVKAGPGTAVLCAGGRTGPLKEESEEMSVYEIAQPQAIGVSRGEIAIVLPDSRNHAVVLLDGTPSLLSPFHSSAQASGLVTPAEPPNSDAAAPTTADRQVGISWMNGLVADRGLLANLTANLQGSVNPQFQSLGRLISAVSGSLDGAGIGGFVTPTSTPASPPNEQLMQQSWNSPADWVGEVVDLGLDGTATVRLGAMIPARTIHVPVEQLHVVYSDEIGGPDDEDDDYSSDDDLIDVDEDSDFELTTVDDPDPPGRIEVFYEGNRRVDSHGGEDDWMTDDEGGVDMELPPAHLDEAERASLTRQRRENSSSRSSTASSMDIEMSELEDVPPPANEQIEATGTDPNDHLSPALPGSFPEPSVSSSMGATRQNHPEAFTLPRGTSDLAPERFSILDSDVPSNHKFASEEAVASSAFSRRLLKEHRILASSLPEGIFVRTWSSRLDLLRVLIIGPINTPYELAPFVFDFYLGGGFPSQAPKAHFHSWTNGIGRVNPNLYEDGKICLSLLGTWHGEERSENWNGAKSTLLQLFVSLMGLVLVKEPYYNEAGYNIFQGSDEGRVNSALYSEKAYMLSRGFVLHVLNNNIGDIDEITKWLYLPSHENKASSPNLLRDIVKQGAEVVARSMDNQVDGDTTPGALGREGVGRVTRGAVVPLRRTLEALESLLKAHDSEPT